MHCPSIQTVSGHHHALSLNPDCVRTPSCTVPQSRLCQDTIMHCTIALTDMHYCHWKCTTVTLLVLLEARVDLSHWQAHAVHTGNIPLSLEAMQMHYCPYRGPCRCTTVPRGPCRCTTVQTSHQRDHLNLQSY